MDISDIKAKVLSSILERQQLGEATISRKSHLYQSTSAAYMLQICIDGKEAAEIFCKEGSTNPRQDGFRWGIEYEAWVYEYILQPSRAKVPKFYGTWINKEKETITLALENLKDITRVNKSADPRAIVRAAAWLGKFHRSMEIEKINGNCFALIKKNNEDFFSKWLIDARTFLEASIEDEPVLEQLLEKANSLAAELAGKQDTIVHGDFSPNNILYSASGVVYVVDWESAALGTSASDFAALTNGWKDEVCRACLEAYSWERWENTAPKGFSRLIVIGKLFNLLRKPGLQKTAAKEEWGKARAAAIAKTTKMIFKN